MATTSLYSQLTTSDLSPSWASTNLANYDMDQTNEASSTNLSYSIPASATRSWGLITVSSLMNHDSWGTYGNATGIVLHLFNTSMDLRGRNRLHRLSSTGTILETESAWGSWVTLDATSVNLSNNGITWSSSNCSDRLAFEIEIENLNSMKAIDFEPEIGLSQTSGRWNLYPIDSATCTGGATFTPKCVMF